MLQGVVERARGHIYIRLPGNGYSSQFYRMLELAVTAPLTGLIPTVLLQKLDELFTFMVVMT